MRTRLDQLTADLVELAYQSPGESWTADRDRRWKLALRAKSAEIFRLGVEVGWEEARADDTG